MTECSTLAHATRKGAAHEPTHPLTQTQIQTHTTRTPQVTFASTIPLACRCDFCLKVNRFKEAIAGAGNVCFFLFEGKYGAVSMTAPFRSLPLMMHGVISIGDTSAYNEEKR